MEIFIALIAVVICWLPWIFAGWLLGKVYED